MDRSGEIGVKMGFFWSKICSGFLNGSIDAISGLLDIDGKIASNTLLTGSKVFIVTSVLTGNIFHSQGLASREDKHDRQK